MNGNYGWGLPIAASTYAKDIDFGIILIHVAMFAIFILWGIFFTYLLIRYRHREGVPAERDPHDDETPVAVEVPDYVAGFPFAELIYRHKHTFKSLAPDILVMVFEIALIAFYAIPVWSRIKMTVPKVDSFNEVEVVAEQFAWNVHYPGPDGKFGRTAPELIHFSNPLGLDHDDLSSQDDVTIANEIHMPTGKPTLVHLTAKDVIHSFFIPEFRIKQDAVPGMNIPVWVEPTKPGTYELTCAQLCGFGHSLMRADVIVQTPEDYAAWLKSQATQAPAAAPAPDF